MANRHNNNKCVLGEIQRGAFCYLRQTLQMYISMTNFVLPYSVPIRFLLYNMPEKHGPSKLSENIFENGYPELNKERILVQQGNLLVIGMSP